MKRMIKRCAGLDVHQATVVACVLIHEGRKPPRSPGFPNKPLGVLVGGRIFV